jgi:hypothetical protein
MPFKNGDGVDGSGCFAITGAVNDALVLEPLAARAAAWDSTVVPGIATFSAAEASNATTPRSTDDATRSVNN